MTTFEQALHIFRKDARHLRFEIAGILLLTMLLLFTGVQTWEGLQERGGPNSNDNPLSVLLPVAWCLLIARAIQTEALPGDRHFWLTRPYSRAGLVMSKVMVVGAFIMLPFLLAQAAIVVLAGLPLITNLGGLLWNQLLIAVLLLLPVAAIATLTRNLAQFLPAVVVIVGLLTIPLSDIRGLGEMEWIRYSLGFAILATIGTLVVWRQYRLRRSGNTAMLATAAGAVGMILYLSFPHSLAFAIQSRVIGSPDGKFALRLAEATPRGTEPTTVNRYQQQLVLPIAVTGAAPQDLRVSSYRTTFKTLSGITRQPSARMNLKEEKLVQSTSLDRKFFDAAKDVPINLRAEFYVVQFGNTHSTDVPLDGTPVYIDGPGQCGVVASYDRRQFVCRAAFQSPKPFVSERVKRGEEWRNWRQAYSPFPARVSIYPIISRTYELAGSGSDDIAPAVPERPAVLRVRDPIAYFRYTMEASNIRLADFATNDPKENDER